MIVFNHFCRFSVGMEEESLGLTDRFERAAEEDQKWMPQIFMPNKNASMINIVPLLDPSILEQAQFFDEKFPKSSCFLFHGFQGIDDSDRIVNALKTSAVLYGSRIRASKRNTKSAVRAVQIDLFCNKSKQNKCRIHSFNENSIQANNTIIQREHQIASRKGRSRSATNKLVKDNNLAIGEKASPVRKSTSMRPLEKKNCCSFGFTIFCHSVNQKWYLSYSKA